MIDADFPDAHVLVVDGTYYAYATTAGTKNIQIARSENLVDWEILPDALPELASWSGMVTSGSDAPQRATWAPEVMPGADGFVMYYSTPALEIARHPDGAPAQCISRAVSDTPEGPFVDTSTGPLVCESELGGSIDSHVFRDEDGTSYLLWRSGCCGMPNRIHMQELSEDGSSVVGELIDTGIRNDKPWEGYVVEAPSLFERDGTYYLLYSGNDPFGWLYAVGYATSNSVTGPYAKAEENPIVVSAKPAAGPGHQSVVEDADGELWLTYHAWVAPNVGYTDGGHRALWIDELVVDGGTLRVDGPDAGPQAIP